MAIVEYNNPYAALPRALGQPSAFVTEIAPAVRPLPLQLSMRERMIEAALVQPNVQTNIALVTPAKQDEVTNIRRKVTLKQVDQATKRKAVVSTSAVENGSEALAAEL